MQRPGSPNRSRRSRSSALPPDVQLPATNQPAHPAFAAVSPAQLQAAHLTAEGHSVSDIARVLGVDRVTVWRWKRLETFQAALNAILAELQAAARLSYLSRVGKALRALDGLLEAENEGVRLRAALEVLERANAASVGHTDAERIVRDDMAKRVDSPWSDPAIFEAMDRLLRDMDEETPEGAERARLTAERLSQLGLSAERDGIEP